MAYSWLNAPQFITTTTVKDKAAIISVIADIYNMKWLLLTDKDPNAIHHATNYVVQKKKELDEQIEIAQMTWDDEEEEEEDEISGRD
jgi:hypothetical protein